MNEHKPRKHTELPTVVQLGDGETTDIAGMSLHDLVSMRESLVEQIAQQPRLDLELRAVCREIRRKAKV